MNLHENKQLFADAILAASQAREDGGLGQTGLSGEGLLDYPLAETAA